MDLQLFKNPSMIKSMQLHAFIKQYSHFQNKVLVARHYRCKTWRITTYTQITYDLVVVVVVVAVVVRSVCDRGEGGGGRGGGGGMHHMQKELDDWRYFLIMMFWYSVCHAKCLKPIANETTCSHTYSMAYVTMSSNVKYVLQYTETHTGT